MAPMHADHGLGRLADAAGIEPRYWDVAGNLYETSPETMRALCCGLGFPAASAAEIAASLAALDDAEWAAMLPPVIVARAGDEIAVPLRLPVRDGVRVARWFVQMESGERRAGDCDLSALPVEATGQAHGSPVALRYLRLAPLPLGYHEFRLSAADAAVCPLIVAPARCHLPEAFSHGRCWGIAAQLYALRSDADWGMGDFGDLVTLVALAAEAGADAVGLNPLHALFLDTPEQASPYSPNSRLFRNPLYLDLPRLADFGEAGEAAGAVPRLVRAGDLIDYKAVAALKRDTLERMYRSFEHRHLARGSARGAAFRGFVERSGPALRSFATFQMLSEHLGTHDWRRWPGRFGDCESGDVRKIQRQQAGRVEFFEYLQWLCEEQFSQAAEAAARGGMAIGLFNDLAVSADAPSADHWAQRGLFAGGLRIGAPPDPFNERGQEWGVVPMNPRRLAATGYAHFIALLRANMRHAGALRIDHVMGWQRLFLIPEGATPASGTYVRYPLDDLLAIAALESHRNRCLVIGEDLGTVPEGFRERMAGANVLSCRILCFERDGERFRRPGEYPALAAVSASTHDLATLRGFWTGEDITQKAGLGILASAEEARRAQSAREADKRALLEALEAEGLLPDGVSPARAGDLGWTADLARAIHVYLARTPSKLLMVQLDDMAGETHQANLPGSTTEYPNWRRRLSRSLTGLREDLSIRSQLMSIASERSRR